MRRIICYFKGHTLEKEPICQTILGTNWLRKCTRCGRYVMKGDIGAITVSEKYALEFASEFTALQKEIEAHL